MWRKLVKLYRLPFMMHEPGEETEGKYMADIPTLPGCRAWGDTAAEALGNLQGVATAFVESYKARQDAVPLEVEAASQEVVDPHQFGVSF